VTIALFSSAYAPAVGGVEELTHRLAQRLSAAGHTVEVWTNRHPGTLPDRETIDGVRVRRFALPLPTMRAQQLAALAPASAAGLVRLRRAARELRPDVLHVQCFSANGVYATALSVQMRLPLVVTLQGETVMDDRDIFDHSLSLRMGLRVGLRRAHAVTACSQFVLDDAERRFGLGRGAGEVVPNGVETDRREPHIPLTLPFRRFVLGLGRVVEKKGFDLLLESFARLASDHTDVGLVIGGDGDQRPALTERARILGLDHRVVLPGSLSRGQVAWAMSNAAAFVLPSRVEPFGIVVLEALDAGQPVVVSSRGGAPEIVRDGREGLVVDPFDTGALASAIGRLLDDGALRRRLTVAGRARARAFSWDTITERYRDIYRSIS
jgi:glycogen(starch) synthase